MCLWSSPSTAPRPLVAVRSRNPFVGKSKCQGTNLGGLAHGPGMVFAEPGRGTTATFLMNSGLGIV
jgi:hypothetical protein